MQKLPLFTLILFSLASMASVLTAQRSHNIWTPPLKNGIAAKVEDQVITFEEVRKELWPLIPQIRSESKSPIEFDKKMRAVYLDILHSLIDRILIVRKFHDNEFRLPETVVENEFERVLIEDFENNRMKLLKHLESQGLNVREFKERLEERVIVSVMRNRMNKSKAEISPEKIIDFYNKNKIHFFQEESVHLRLIMLKPFADESPDLLQQTANKVMEELNAGASFAKVAEKYSQDSKKNNGGDWEWIKRGDLRHELSEVAFTLQKGTFSQPIKLENQIFILYVEAKRDEGIQPLESVRDRIEQILHGQIVKQAQKRWIERLRKEAFIKYY